MNPTPNATTQSSAVEAERERRDRQQLELVRATPQTEQPAPAANQ